MAGHDVVVIGTSSGGVEALFALLRALPRDLQAAVFIVVHRNTYVESNLLAEVLASSSNQVPGQADDTRTLWRPLGRPTGDFSSRDFSTIRRSGR